MRTRTVQNPVNDLTKSIMLILKNTRTHVVRLKPLKPTI